MAEETTAKASSSAEETVPLNEVDAPLEVVVHEWTSITSVHGLLYIFDVHSRTWKRLLFAVIFVACLGLLGWNLGVIFSTYFEYGTTTSIQTIAPASLDFPDVTVCNVNPFSASRVEDTGITAPQNDQEMNLISQPLDELMILTEFSGEDLNVTDYWTQTVTDAGPCWTFHTDATVTQPGLSEGLSFFAFINRDNYYLGSDVEGVYIYVTQANTTTLTIETPFTDLSAGKFHTVFLDVTDYQREERHPWSTCVKSPVSYSQPACRAECFFDYFVQECGCRTLGDNRPENANLDYCKSSFNDDDSLDCLEVPGAESLACACPDPPCRETVYRTRISSLELSQSFVLDLVDATGTDEDFVRSNVVAVHVNFEAIRREEVTESRAVTPSGLLAAIGGLLGFFVGMSVFSFAEVFDLCCLRLLPRSWGDRRIYGVGSIDDTQETSVLDEQAEPIESIGLGPPRSNGGADSEIPLEETSNISMTA